MSWDKYFMNMLPLIAAKSKDKHTQVGAIIVGPDNEIRSTGYNSFVRGLDDTVPERFERPEKYTWIEHAERNSIYNAARVGIPLKDCTIYTPGRPCIDCARAIVSVGITRSVIGENKVWSKDPARIKELEIEWSKIETMFIECGIWLVYQ
jgi:dCMP deaminase